MGDPRQSADFERATCNRAADIEASDRAHPAAPGEDEATPPHLLLVRSLYIQDQNTKTARVGQFPVKQVWDISPEVKMAHTGSPFNKL